MEDTMCLICGSDCLPQDEGLSICGSRICRGCEERIVSSVVYDKHYQELIERVKQIWKGLGSIPNPACRD